MGIVDYNVNDGYSGVLLIKNVRKGTTTNGKEFLALSLGDKTGSIIANVWEPTDEQKGFIVLGAVVNVDGKVTEYRGKRQININSIGTTDGVEIDLSQLLQAAPEKGNDMLGTIVKTIKSFENNIIKEITFNLMKKHSDKFKTHPAAKNVHHSYVGGLAYHTFTMLKIGESLCEIYPVLNRDLLLAGIILHDVGKINEYTGYIGTDSTLQGKLKGHISIMSEEIALIANELNYAEEEETLLLQHMILSHHGLQSNGWGSTVSPLTIEANILHRIDLIDAEMDMYKDVLTKTKVKEFTENIFGMSNRSLYIHGLESNID